MCVFVVWGCLYKHIDTYIDLPYFLSGCIVFHCMWYTLIYLTRSLFMNVWIISNLLLFKQHCIDYLVFAIFCGCIFAGYLVNKSPELELLGQLICIINQCYQIVLHMSWINFYSHKKHNYTPTRDSLAQWAVKLLNLYQSDKEIIVIWISLVTSEIVPLFTHSRAICTTLSVNCL